MSRIDRSSPAVAARISEALRLGHAASGRGLLAKGVRTDGAAVRTRLRQVNELRRLASRLRAT